MDVVYHPQVGQQEAFDTVLAVISDKSMSNSSLKFINDRKPVMKLVSYLGDQEYTGLPYG